MKSGMNHWVTTTDAVDVQVNGTGPFAIVYVELDTEVLVLAVAHGRRRPGYWRERVPPAAT